MKTLTEAVEAVRTARVALNANPNSKTQAAFDSATSELNKLVHGFRGK